MDTKLFGKRLNAVRKERNFTADKLSELCNINATYLRQIESGIKLPSLPVFISLCNTLKVSPDYLLQDILVDNEITDIELVTELWKRASLSKQALAIKMLQAVLESDVL